MLLGILRGCTICPDKYKIPPMTAHTSSPTLLDRLIHRALGPVATRDRARAARHLLDWLACSLAAIKFKEAHQFRAALDLPDRPFPAIWYPEVSPQLAALADGALGSMLEMDDVHRSAVLHPGPVIVPAALATARACRSDVGQLLDSLVRGYEIMIRLGRALGLTHYRYWHPTSTCGAFGAAMAAGSIRQLAPTAMVWALANAGSRTGGMWQMRHEPVPTKAVHTGLTAQSGWLGAALAEQGFAGPASLLEGDQGLFAATTSTARPDDLLVDDHDWLIHEVSFKPWPACRHAHAAMDALLALDPLPRAADISHIEVGTYRAALDFCDCPQPTTSGEARFSLQHALASILLRGRPALAHYDADQLHQNELQGLRKRITLLVDDASQARFPEHFGAMVRVHLHDGSRLEARVEDAWGDPEWPLSDRDLATKASDLLHHAGWRSERIEHLIETMLGLADHPHQQVWPILESLSP